jgi:hypothetical protein
VRRQTACVAGSKKLPAEAEHPRAIEMKNGCKGCGCVKKERVPAKEAG